MQCEAPLTFGAGGALVAWVVSARHWFHGPVRTIGSTSTVEGLDGMSEKSPQMDSKEKDERGSSTEVVVVDESMD